MPSDIVIGLCENIFPEILFFKPGNENSPIRNVISEQPQKIVTGVHASRIGGTDFPACLWAVEALPGDGDRVAVTLLRQRTVLADCAHRAAVDFRGQIVVVYHSSCSLRWIV